ncbi:MAG: tetratricopeptide repeat protein [Spirochaetaceae bacterium]
MLLMLLAVLAGAQESLLARGEALYMQNKPREAASVLEAALEEQPNNQKLHLYLGVVYEQLELYNQAISTLDRGASLGGGYTADIHLNLGNNLFRLGRLEEAEEAYTEALRANGRLEDAYLNRANLRVRTESYEDAISDYTVYLNLEPDAPQEPEIRRMISLLQGTLEAEEARIAEEERRRREEEAQRQALLNSVLNSLDSAGRETQSLSGGSEDIRQSEDTIDIAD